ncbi:MAG: DUF4194 domain-containing protein [Treponema sp.]
MTAKWAAPCIKLLQGTLYEDDSTGEVWRLLMQYQQEVAAFFDQIGVRVFIEPSEGYAFLEQDDTGDEESDSLRLIRRHPLTFEMSLLCVLLREALEQFDVSQSDSAILVLTESEIRAMLSIYFQEKTDQTKLYRDLTKYLTQAVELGFLKELRHNQPAGLSDTDIDRRFEVRRIVRAKITVDFLLEFKKRLEEC